MAAADKGEELADQFALLDHDKNGEITAAELLHTVTELGLSLADEEVWPRLVSLKRQFNHFIFCRLMRSSDMLISTVMVKLR